MANIRLLLFILFASSTISSFADPMDQSLYQFSNELRPFTTDGCSVVPDFNFTSCCVAHDLAYWQGGTKDKRDIADKDLKICIEQKSNPLMATLFYWGVRLGGHPNRLTSYRWGYGWKYPRGYKELNEMENEIISKLDPGDIYSYPILDSENNYDPLPSPNNNYCLDEIYQTILKHYPDGNIHITNMRKTKDYYFTKIKLWLNNSDKVIVTYKNKTYENCQKPKYLMTSATHYLKFNYLKNKILK